MEKYLVRFALVILFCLIQISFVPNIVSTEPTPVFILLLCLAWTMELGFLGILPWLIFAGIVSDLAFTVPVGVNVILLTVSAYSVSFLSKRFLVANRGGGLLLVALISIGLNFFYHWTIAAYNMALYGIEFGISIKTSYYVFASIQTFFLFLIIFSLVSWIEKYLSFYDKKIDIKIR